MGLDVAAPKSQVSGGPPAARCQHIQLDHVIMLNKVNLGMCCRSNARRVCYFKQEFSTLYSGNIQSTRPSCRDIIHQHFDYLERGRHWTHR